MDDFDQRFWREWTAEYLKLIIPILGIVMIPVMVILSMVGCVIVATILALVVLP